MNSGRSRRSGPESRGYPDAGYNDGYGSYGGEPWPYEPWAYEESKRYPAERYGDPADQFGATGGEYADYGPQHYTLHDFVNARAGRFYGRGNYDKHRAADHPSYGQGSSSDRYGSTYAVHKGKGPRNYKRSDERIKEEINDRLTDDPYVDAIEIDIDVRNGEVTLSGMVNDRSERRRAEDIAGSVSGVTQVENILRVTSSVPSSNRNYL